MPQHVEVNGQIVEFPDGMSADDIGAAIKKNALGIPKTSAASDFFSALGHHVMSIPHGAAQLVENAASGVANAISPSSALTRKITSVVDADNAAMAKREADYQGSTPNSPSAYAGATLGEVAPFLISGPARALQAAGDAVSGLLPKATPKLLQRTVSGGAQGATISAAQPVTDGDYWQGKQGQIEGGAAVGGAIPGGAALVRGATSGVVNAARPILAPKTVVSPLLQKMAGNDPEMLDALRNPQQLVPGSMPTTAQIIGTPQAVATEKLFSNTGAGKLLMAERQNANNDARLAAVQGVAKSPEDIAAALKARSDAVGDWTGPQGKLATGAPVDATPILQQLDALAASPLGIRPMIGSAAQEMASTIRNRATGDSPMVSPGDLDAVRQNVRDFLAKHAPNGVVGTQQQAAFEPVRGAIVDAVESANPGYRDYLATYAKASRPINTMEAAGGILDNVAGDSRSANSSGAPQVTLSRYSSALAKALKAPYGIDPEAQKTLEAVQQDLQRESTSSGLRSSGSDTAYNLEAPGWLAGQLYGRNMSGATPAAARVAGGLTGGIGGWLGGGAFGAAGGATAGAAAMSKIAQFGQGRVNDVLGRAMTDPEFAAQLLQDANAKRAPGLLSSQPQISGLLGF